MSNKKDGRKKNGGRRKGAGRKPGPVPKSKMTVSVPTKYEVEIKQATVKIAKAYEQKCLNENEK